MAARSNLSYNLEHRLAHLKGEREEAMAQLRAIEESVARLSALHDQITRLNKAIEAAEVLIVHDRPDATPERVAAVRPRKWNSPFKSGEIGRTALATLRENGGWMRPFTIAVLMLERIDYDSSDRLAREKLTNSVGAYLRSHEGDLVESRGDFAKEWRVIR